MLPFNVYNKLSRGSKKCSLIFWISELLVLSKCKNINQLTNYLAYRSPNICEQKRRSTYLYKKNRGQPIKTDKYPLLIDNVLPGSANVLFNPLWVLLEPNELAGSDLVKFSSYLPFDIQKRLLSNDRRRIKGNAKEIFKLTQLNTLDALTAALIIFLHIKATLSNYLTYWVNREITQLIFRLFLIRFNNYEAGYYLIQKLALLFKKINMQPNQSHAIFTLWEDEKHRNIRMPITLSFISSPQVLHVYCEVEKYITHMAIVRLELENTASIKHQIYNCLDHNNLDELTWNFYEIEKGNSPTSDAEIWKLRDKLTI